MSTPLLAEGELVGVLTFYSSVLNGFTDDHRRIMEATANQIAHTLKRATELEFHGRDSLATLPDLHQLEQFLNVAGAHYLNQKSSFTLLLITVIGLDHLNLARGRSARDQALRHVADHATAGLRSADILFRYGDDEFVALLNDTSPEAAAIVATRIRIALRNTPLPLRDNRSIVIDVSVEDVTSPADGRSLANLIDTARSRSRAAINGFGWPSIALKSN
jgi:diguanylate cyclase (GGDEF)-like protein